MQSTLKRLSLFLATAAALAGTFLFVVQPGFGQAEEEFTNLQILPVDID